MKSAGALIEGEYPIYDMLRVADTDKPCLHLVYEMWDSMIEKVKTTIYRHKGLEDAEYSSFWSVVYYSIEWLSENPKRIAPHRDHEISMERSKCLDRYFEDESELKVVKFEFAAFSRGRFPSPDALKDRFIHSLKRNKITPTRAKDLVYVHSNLRLLSRHNVKYVNTAIKMWDITRDSWNEGDIHGGAGILENATLTLDEPELEVMVIGNANTSATTSESEVRSETIDLDDEEVGV
ncbi:hypothetical protein RGQ29_006862 [Quercus rubra]|uniref:Uncharacterized protein n=1 Tax=Quercus rubra TaxID=3512 RepID=A0AAN7E827_QUERU|nr:hypothetical protein RGQ29_006862 [Quercus rubra]